jgi:hypothetical protein
MYFWVGVSTLAGALRRRVWIDQVYFRWYPNFYIILVAPPGIVSKSTTASIGMSLLRQVPGVKFGPEIVTWQALAKSLAESGEAFELDGVFHAMSAITIESSEFGNLLNPDDRDMIDLLVTLWDGRQGTMRKVTKLAGTDEIVNPWINIVACTTPSWIAGNFPEYLIGGGFTSRCVFVFADAKEKYVAYPRERVPAGMADRAIELVHDLEYVAATMCGEFTLTREAITWGTQWYQDHYENRPDGLDDQRFGGYIARKQTHIHKLAMVISASQRDTMRIELEDLVLANTMVTDLESDMPKVFARLGQNEASGHMDRLISLIHRRGRMRYEEVYRFAQTYFPDARDFEGMLTTALRAQVVRLVYEGKQAFLEPIDSRPNNDEVIRP